MKLKKLVLTAILSSMSIVLNEFVSVRIPPSNTIFTLSLGIIPILFIAYYAGILYSTVAAVIIDVLGWLIGGTSSPFNLGFTFNAFLSGLILGLTIMFKDKLKGKPGRILIIITELIYTLVTIPIFLIFFNKFGLSARYNFNNASIIIVSIAAIANILLVFYSLVMDKNDESNAVTLGFQIYQIIVSLLLTPLWVHILYGSNYIALWAMRLISVPILTIVYALISELILKTLTKIYKAGHFNEK